MQNSSAFFARYAEEFNRQTSSAIKYVKSMMALNRYSMLKDVP